MLGREAVVPSGVERLRDANLVAAASVDARNDKEGE
jgi:hypothetical protein